MCLSLWFSASIDDSGQMEELCRYIPRIDNDDDDDDDGYDTPAATESWDVACNDYASFLEHRQMWAAVMTDLGMIRPLERVEMGMSHACNAQGEPRMSLARLDKEALARLPRSDRRWIWEAVMGELIVAVNVQRMQRPTKLIDRRGKSLPRLNFD